MTDDVKQEVGRFYDQIGWQQEGEDGLYQNAQYEDLRPVAADYIARGHARVAENLDPTGEYLLDAGSGPVQYQAYLAYSKGYKRRVCLDLSFVAVSEARKRLGEHGLYVVADVTQLPFKREVFDGIVSLHTIHHVPVSEKAACYQGLYACLKPGRRMVTVDGWHELGLGKVMHVLIRLAERRKRSQAAQPKQEAAAAASTPVKADKPAGTFVIKNSAGWFKQALGGVLPFQIKSWRSVSVHFLRSVIPDNARGKRWLRWLSRLEDRFPRFFGENGQYPLIAFQKPAKSGGERGS